MRLFNFRTVPTPFQMPLPRPALLALGGLTLALSAGLTPLTATAQDIQTETITLPAGKLTMTVDQVEFTGSITDGTTTLPVETGYMPYEQARHGNSVLLFLNSGGSACPGNFIWVTLDDKGLRSTPEFGTCSDLAEVSESEQGVVAVIPRMDGSGVSAFTFDGTEMTESDLGPQQAGITDPRDAAAWAGKWAGEVLSAAEMEPILLEIMPQEVLDEVRISGQIASEGMEPDGNWYAATGCRPHFCGDELAGVAISTEDGRVVVVQWDSTNGAKIYGNAGGALPGKLQDLVNGKF